MRSRRLHAGSGGFGALVMMSITVALGGLGCSSTAAPERIVLIVVDTLRRDYLGCYGAKGRTRNIDRLAENGQLFTNAFSSFHQTTMSMGALFTGRTPSLESGGGRVLDWNGRNWCGLSRFADPSGEEGCIPKSVRTLPEFLREAGYWTIGIATNQLLFRPAGFERGFDDWVEHGRRSSWREVNQAALEAVARRARDKFFLYVHYMDVHDHRRGSWSYTRSVSQVDRGVGELLDALEERALLEDAVVILASDHGERLKETHLTQGQAGHYGNPSFEEVLQVPLIVSPARFEDTTQPVRSEDVFRLITGLAGVRSESAHALEPEELFTSEAGWRTYRQGRWKSLVSRFRGEHLLVDLVDDPGEKQDVAAENPAIVAEHAKRIASLSRALAASNPPLSKLTAEDQRRLRALGYLE
ncbi:MAG: sulfatase [Deltaproteobacteria bacterium]|nr:sulfatase [Deltaproteobacteria bacterium]